MADNTEIPEGWVETTLGEITTFSQWLQVPSEKQELVKKEGYIRFVRIVDYTNDGEIPRYIQNPGWERYLASIDDLVMIRYGSQTAWKIVRWVEGIIANNTFKIIPKFELNKNWLFWFLNQESIYQMLNKDQSSSTMPAINFSQVSRISILLPPLPEQQSIARILSSFDDKIELLREQNETLEKTAQTIFQEWFGKYGIDDELPDGWRVGKVRDFGQIICGKTPPKDNPDYFGGNIPFIKIPDMYGEVYIVKTEDSLTNSGANFQKNKFVPKNSICVSCIATVGLVIITSEDSQTNQQINSIVPSEDYFLEYLYFSFLSLKDELLAIWSGGSATLNVNTSVFSNINLIFPEKQKLDEFHIFTKPIFEKILSNLLQIQSLTKSRDELLPKLMNGEIRV